MIVVFIWFAFLVQFFFRSNYPKVVSRRSPRPIILFRLYKYER